MLPLSDRIAAANTLLAPYAVPHGTGLGRMSEEKDDETRFPFQRDRDRVIHTQAFRRLKGKTQVFVASEGDHFRTRLTHTLEVAQISRDMARTLGLNEDLAECIALAHDLGHTPFGHAGEETMARLMRERGGRFEHNEQSLRIVTLLEERTKHSSGLNLNAEVLEGLMKHRTKYDSPHAADLQRAPSIEAQLVNLADEIAYTAHDVEDGLRAGLLPMNELMEIPLFAEAFATAEKKGTEVRGTLIHLLVLDAYAETERRLTEAKVRTLAEVYAAQAPLSAFSQSMTDRIAILSAKLHECYYRSKEVRGLSMEGQQVIEKLFLAYELHPPEKVTVLQKRTGGTLSEAVKDYIAGMTDQYAFAMVKGVSGK